MGVLIEHNTTRLDDIDLVLHVMCGSIDHYGVLVHRYQDKIYSLMLTRLNNPEDAMDAAQEVFIRAYRNISTFRGESAFYSWLYRIAMNTATDWIRTVKKRGARDVSIEVLEEKIGFEPTCPDHWASPERALKNKELKIAIRKATDRLSENLRGSFVLHDVLGYSQKQTAETLRIPQGTVKSRVSRARQLMREQLADVL